MNYIKVWCEYDFGGEFGGNHDQDVFQIDDRLSHKDIQNLVLKFLCEAIGLDENDLEGCWGWDFITITKLK